MTEIPSDSMLTKAKEQVTIPTASTALPLAYRLTLLVLEPLRALNGAVMTFRAPADYVAHVTHKPALYSPANQFLYMQLGGAWLLFAFNEAVVLRLVDDLRVWRLLCWGMLVSDIVYHVSSVQAVGGWGEFVRVGEWNTFDWAVFASAVVPMVVRLLVVAGVGVKTNKVGEKAK
ncbi:hypothetical protein N657DRAFT_642324 [Parathielavia appendiculata]|uniref:DUF7704 domain-containing protein n=1 Tax=Parathielavia appendiculata TaxID=2587402 RepID=A0AAN6U391_9PEZI|nr:hypothetical protein N657DRAFT_642324 [Parathielavia appendiculata]